MSKKSKTVPIAASFDSIGTCHYKISVKVPAERVAQEYEHAIRAATRNVKIPGFRPGKAPMEMLRGMVGDGLQAEASEHLLEHVVPEALVETKLEVLRLMDFDATKHDIPEGQDYSFDFEVETAPDIELPEWSEINIEAMPTDPSDEQIEETLKAIGRDHPRFEEKEGASLDSDTLADSDIQFFMNGDEGPEAKDLKLALGSPLYGSNPETYDEKMTGAKPGDKLELDVEFNEGFEKSEWVGEKGTVKVTVKRIVTPRHANVEELIQDLQIESEEKLREMVSGRIGMENEANERRRQVEEALASILSLKPFDLPNRLIDEEAEHAEKGAVERIQKGGKSEEEAKKEAEGQRPAIRENSKKNLQMYFLLRRIAASAQLSVNKKDMDQAYREIGMQNGTDVKTTKAFYQERGLESQLKGDILEGKARNFVAIQLAAQNAPAPEVEASSAAE
ncbi:MAG: trigger factor [Planctomycetota bacterium]|nr:trigger factor [Planctomycetota bacterium]